MAQETSTTKNPSQARVDALHAVFDVANAEQEAKVRSMLAKNGWRYTPKSKEEEEAEDADLFAPQVPNLGLGFPIPKQFLDGDFKRKDIASNDKLRQLITGKKGGFQASKPRDAQEKAGSAKRGLKAESSDEEEGRSALGKAKKTKTSVDEAVSTLPSWMQAKILGHDSKSATKVDSSHVAVQESKPLFKGEPKSEQPKASLQVPKKLKNVTRKKPLVDYPSEDEDERSSTSSLKKGQKTKAPLASAFDIPDDSVNPPAKPLGAKIQSVKQVANSKTSSTTTSGSDSGSEMETVIPTGLTADVIPRTALSPSGIDGKPLSKTERKRLKQRNKRERRLHAAAMTSGGEK